MTANDVQHYLPSTRLKWAYSHLVKNPYERLLAASGSDIQLYRMTDGDGLCPVKKLENIGPGKKGATPAPVTNIDWNFVDPAILGSCSIDTTCTIWNVETGQPKTQLIAHDRQVYDISFSNTLDIFSSVGGDGSVRLFDLRNLEHSTILYENNQPTANPKNGPSTKSSSLFRIAWNKLDNHFLATFQESSNAIILLDNRLPSIPVAELVCPDSQATLVDICWAPVSSSHLASMTSEGQLYLWDLLCGTKCSLDDRPSRLTKMSPSFQTTPGAAATTLITPSFGYKLPSVVGCQLIWPLESPEYIAATDNTGLIVIPI